MLIMGFVNKCLKWWCIPTASMQQRSSGQPNSRAACQEIYQSTVLYATRRFTTIFTTSRCWILSWARWNQSTSSHSIYFKIHFSIIFWYMFRLSSESPPFSFLIKMYSFLISPMQGTCCLFYPLIWSIHAPSISGMRGGFPPRHLTFLARCYG
jgi:hypothetical protein